MLSLSVLSRCLTILFRTLFVVLSPKDFYVIWLSGLSIVSLPDECYCRNASYTLNLVSTFLSNKHLDKLPHKNILSRHDHHRMVVGFTTTCDISAYHH